MPHVTDQTHIFGDVPNQIIKALVAAIESVPDTVFFHVNNHTQPCRNEIVELDDRIYDFLSQQRHWGLQKNFHPFNDCEFHVDLACERHKVLIEIEKGTSPRLELDILKVARACLHCPEKWKFGALVVPSTHIHLRLAGRLTPYDYLANHLQPLVRPVLEACNASGFVVIGYREPRPDGQ